jgi:site-specific recombinase XerD
MTTTTDLHRLVELFLRDRHGEVSKQTHYNNNKGHLKQFVEWADDNGVESVRELGGQELLNYKFHLKQDPSKNDTTIGNHFTTLRVFFKFCRTMDATTSDQQLYEKLRSLDFSKGNLSRDDMLDVSQVKSVLDYLERFEYATVRHVPFVILWHTGARAGAVRGLDLEDYRSVRQREHGEYGLLRFRHRPETGTPLKNGSEDKPQSGEREVMV